MTTASISKIIDSFCDAHFCSLTGCPMRTLFPKCGAGFYVGNGNKSQREAAMKIIEAEQILEEGRKTNGSN